jgi:DNA-binding NtrC family response regulator
MGRKKAKPGARAGKAAARDASLAPLRSKDLPSLKAFRERMDREYLQALLQATEGDVAKALEIADISRAGYYNLLKKHGLTGSQS